MDNVPLTINISNFALIVSLIVALGGVVMAFYRLFARFERLEKQATHRKEDDEIILNALLAILDGLHEQGCNNTVTTMRKKLQEHLIESR